VDRLCSQRDGLPGQIDAVNTDSGDAGRRGSPRYHDTHCCGVDDERPVIA
jgi:hypothetical protein